MSIVAQRGRANGLDVAQHVGPVGTIDEMRPETPEEGVDGATRRGELFWTNEKCPESQG
jgi:hypothetical protein